MNHGNDHLLCVLNIIQLTALFVRQCLEKRIQRLEDVREIENLMAKYAYLHTAGMHEETAGLFAPETSGVRGEISWGGGKAPKESIRRW